MTDENKSIEFTCDASEWEPVTILGWPVIPGTLNEQTGGRDFKFASSVYIGRDTRDIRAQIFAKRCISDD